MQPVRFGGAYAWRGSEKTTEHIDAMLMPTAASPPFLYLLIPGETQHVAVVPDATSDRFETVLKAQSPPVQWKPLDGVPVVDMPLIERLRDAIPLTAGPEPPCNSVDQLYHALAALANPHRGRLAHKALATSAPAVFRPRRQGGAFPHWTDADA